jgi:hypothetical protein
MTAQLEMFGDLDGEPIDAIAVKLSGTGRLDRKIGEGERVVLMITGTASLPALQRIDGKLFRVHTIKAERIAEPVAELADEVEAFIQAVEDKRKGQDPLPMDDEEGEDA